MLKMEFELTSQSIIISTDNFSSISSSFLVVTVMSFRFNDSSSWFVCGVGVIAAAVLFVARGDDAGGVAAAVAAEESFAVKDRDDIVTFNKLA